MIAERVQLRGRASSSTPRPRTRPSPRSASPTARAREGAAGGARQVARGRRGEEVRSRRRLIALLCAAGLLGVPRRPGRQRRRHRRRRQACASPRTRACWSPRRSPSTTRAPTTRPTATSRSTRARRSPTSSVSEKGRVYRPGGCTVQGCTDETGRFGLTTNPDGDGIRIVWHHNAIERGAHVHGRLPRSPGPRDRLRRRDRRLLAGLGRPVGLRPRPPHRRPHGPGAEPIREEATPRTLGVWGHPRDVEGETSASPGVARLEASDVHDQPVRRDAGDWSRARPARASSAAGAGEGDGLREDPGGGGGSRRRLQLALQQDQALDRRERRCCWRPARRPRDRGPAAADAAGARAPDLDARSTCPSRPTTPARRSPTGSRTRAATPGHRPGDPARPGRTRLLRHEDDRRRGREARPRVCEGLEAADAASSSRTRRRC